MRAQSWVGVFVLFKRQSILYGHLFNKQKVQCISFNNVNVMALNDLCTSLTACNYNISVP